MLKSMAFENHSAASAYLGGLALNSSKAFCLQLLNSALTASPEAASFGASSVRGGGGAWRGARGRPSSWPHIVSRETEV